MSPPGATPCETPESTRTMPYEPYPPQQISNFPSFLNFLPEGPSTPAYYGSYGNADIVPSGMEWVFDNNFNDTLTPFPYSPSGPYSSMQTLTPIPNAAQAEGLAPSLPLNVERSPNGEDNQLSSTVSLTPTEHFEDGNVPEDQWPMEWRAVPVQLHAIPVLANVEGSSPYANHFDYPPITSQTRADLVNTLKLPMQKSPWQVVSLANFPSERTLDRCIDLYFVHFDKVSTKLIVINHH